MPSHARLGASLGLTGWLLPQLGLYAGAGYGVRRVFWEDAASRWAEVGNLSVRGWTPMHFIR